MTMAIKSICEFGFNQLHLERIFAIVFTFNPASKRALEKCGFKYEGLLRKHNDKNGVLLDSYVFGLLKSEFDAKDVMK
jgi:ribosomal-protein-alanine N-acetyltransferase